MDSWEEDFEDWSKQLESRVSDDEIIILNQMVDLLFQKLKQQEIEIQKLKNG